MSITILGTGYVGLTSAAIFAAAGIKTYVVDKNPARLASVTQGKSFFYEEGLDPLITHALAQDLLIPTNSYANALPRSNIIFSCVGTPDKPDGSSDLSYVFAAAKEAAQHTKPGTVYVQKSTVPAGTGTEVAKLFKSVGYVSNPEFLREGTALQDSLWFDRIVVGGDSKTACKKVIDLYKQVQKNRNKIGRLAGIPTLLQPPQGEYITTSLTSAELAKVSSNAFLALKISFANSIAKLADKTGADITEVMAAVGADPRIGRAFLTAGRGYGGGCFPKDVSGLISTGIQHGVDLEIMQAATVTNDSMPGYIAEKLQLALHGSFDGKRVAVLGLSFKKGTSDTRRSPGIALANMLASRGAEVSVYDPQAMDEAKLQLKAGIMQATSIEDSLKGRDAALITTDWPAFIHVPVDKYATLLVQGGVLVDCMNCFTDIAAVTKTGLKYIGVGRGN